MWPASPPARSTASDKRQTVLLHLQKWFLCRLFSTGTEVPTDTELVAATVDLDEGPPLDEPVARSGTFALPDRLRALVDVEPYVTEQRSYHGHAVFCLSPTNTLRRLSIAIIEHKWFTYGVFVMIGLNVAFLAQQQPWGISRAWWTPAELTFQILFTLELVIKVAALGLALHEGAYLRDGWNWIDFLVVLIGWLAFLPGVMNLSVIRALRIFRALRFITQIEGVRRIVVSLLNSLAMIANVLLLFMLSIFFFAVVGVQLFKGRLRYACFESETALMPAESEQVCFCNVDASDFRNAPQLCPPELTGSWRCANELVCRQAASNPNFGVTSFDNLGAAMYNVFEALTLEGWTDVTYMLQAGSSSPMPVIYMSVLVVFLSFFALNLFTAVIFESVQKMREAAASAEESEKRTESASQEVGENANNEGGAATRKRNWLHGIVTHPRFTLLSMLLITLNMLLLACEFHRMPQLLADTLRYSNYVLGCVFIIELLIVMFALGWRDWWADGFNVFDAIVVVLSSIDIIFELAGKDIPGNFSVFRALRMLRVFKLARSWTGLQHVLMTVIRSLNDIAYLAVLLLILMFTFALLGTQLFGRIFGDPSEPGVLEDTPYTNYNDLGWAMITVSVLISAEDWNDILQDTVGGLLETGGPVAAAYMYHIMVLVVGNFVLINLFIAILLSNFEMIGDALKQERAAAKVLKRLSTLIRSSDLVPARRIDSAMTGSPRSQRGALAAAGGSKDIASAPMAAMGSAMAEGKDVGGTPPGDGTHAAQSGESQRGEQYASLADEPLEGHSLFVFSPTNPFRLACAAVVQHPWFDPAIVMLIIISSVLLIVDSPFVTDPSLITFLRVADYVLTAAFTLELLLKVVTFGLLSTRRAYLRNSFNVLDCLIVLVSILAIALSTLSFESRSLRSLRALRALRVLRPLRLISRNPGMRVVIDVMYKALPAVRNVSLVFLLFLLIFGILGVQLFSGRLGACSDPSIVTRDACVGVFSPGGSNGGELELREWANPSFGNFDNIGSAMLVLFEITSYELWPTVMYGLVDASPDAVDIGPVRNINPPAAIFSIAWVLIGTFFMLNLFVSVVIDEFTRLKSQLNGSSFLTQQQRDWVEMHSTMTLLRVPNRAFYPADDPRKQLSHIIDSTAFQTFIVLVIVLNAIAISIVHLEQPDEMTSVLYVANYCFTVVYIAELALKLVAYGASGYFSELWNVFDFTLVLISLVDIVLDAQSVGTLLFDPIVLRIFRLFRLFRIFRLLKYTRKLSKLFKALLDSAPVLLNVGSLLLLVMAVYALVGVQLFHSVRGEVEQIQAGEVTNFEFVNDWANFESFGVALFTMFRCATGEEWNGIMHDCYEVSVSLSILFFVSNYIVGFIFMTNLFTAAILENVVAVSLDYNAPVTPNHLYGFVKAWADFDLRLEHDRTKASYTMHTTQLPAFLRLVAPPLGFQGTEAKRAEIFRHVCGLHIPDHQGVVHMYEVLYACTHHVCGVALDQDSHLKHISKRVNKAIPALAELQAARPALRDAADVFAASYVQATWRGFAERRTQSRQVKL